MTKIIGLWNAKWGSPLDGFTIDYLIDAIFRKREIKGWDKSLQIFFREAEKLFKKLVNDPDAYPSFPKAFNRKKVEKLHQVFHDSLEYANQEEWDSLFDFKHPT